MEKISLIAKNIIENGQELEATRGFRLCEGQG